MKSSLELKLEFQTLMNQKMTRNERIRKCKPIISGIQEIEINHTQNWTGDDSTLDDYCRAISLWKDIKQYIRPNRKKEFRK